MIDYGYQPNPEAAEALALAEPRYCGEAIDAMRRADTGRDFFAYRALRHLLGRSINLGRRWIAKAVDQSGHVVYRLRARNQGRYGTCVGFGTATALDLMAAVDIATGQREWMPALHSAVGQYGLSRYISKDFGRRDGSYGSATIKAVTGIGTLVQMTYGSIDLTRYSGDRARLYGRGPMPQSLRSAAGDHKVTEFFRPKTGEDVWTLAGHGIPTIMCSSVGWEGRRDDEGAIRRRGRWMHCMCAGAARRTTRRGRRLILVMQSHGDKWSSDDGPYWRDQPFGSFYADVKDIDAAVRQGDCWSVAEHDGFTPVEDGGIW